MNAVLTLYPGNKVHRIYFMYLLGNVKNHKYLSMFDSVSAVQLQ